MYRIAAALCRDVEALQFAAPVTHVYNPLRYAGALHRAYLKAHARAPVPAILLGMNPGPFGMAQTGVPFGAIPVVRDWLQLRGKVDQPPEVHPARPVQGLACTRQEVSGQRLWGWAQARFGSPAEFFAQFFVANYCPLVFMEASGKNRTPDRLPSAERAPLFAACDRALRASVRALGARWVIGVGAFAAARAQAALAGEAVQVGTILHPSPASPLANRGWAAQASAQLRALGLPTQACKPGRAPVRI